MRPARLGLPHKPSPRAISVVGDTQAAKAISRELHAPETKDFARGEVEACSELAIGGDGEHE